MLKSELEAEVKRLKDKLSKVDGGKMNAEDFIEARNAIAREQNTLDPISGKQSIHAGIPVFNHIKLPWSNPHKQTIQQEKNNDHHITCQAAKKSANLFSKLRPHGYSHLNT